MLARTRQVRYKDVLVTQTIREFDGGWNVIDNDLNLQLKYSTELENMIRKDDGSIGIRWGTQFFAEVPVVDPEYVVNVEYFQDNLIVVTSAGNVWRVGADAIPVQMWPTDLTGNPAWTVSTGYLQDDIVSDTGNYYVCITAHTSGATTIADDILANPLWWLEIGNVDPWIGSDFVSFAAFHDHLIICNGVDKPLRVNLLDVVPVRYLGDEGSGGSNADVPVARYVMVMSKFVLMAGDVQEPGLLYISSENTSGVWLQADQIAIDPLNKAVNVRITKKVNTNTETINGIARYRDKVVVMFDEVIALGTLGNLVNIAAEGAAPDLIHEPIFDDAIEAHGCISHRSTQFLGDDLLMADLVGVASIARTAISDSITPSRPSELIDPAIQQAMRQLSVGTALDRVFSVYNLIEKQYMLFIPNHDDNAVILADPEVIIADFTTNELVINAPTHNMLDNEFITISGCALFNTFTDAEINRSHQVHNVINENYFTIQPTTATPLDQDGDISNRESDENNVPTIIATRSETYGYVLNHRKTGKNVRAWSRFRDWNWNCGCRTLLGNIFFADNSKLYIYGSHQNTFYEDFINDPSQTPINWSWELPWHDFKKRIETKRLKYLGMDTRGESDYTISAFIDDIYRDELGHRDPALTMHVYGRDSGGYGQGTQPYGGGRRMEGERLFAWPTKFKLMKLRFEGSSIKPLRIISILLALQAGSIRR